jgi:alcohol dehydrogenase class IV
VVFEFATASRIIFGPETLKQIGPLAREMGNRALVVLGKNFSRAESLLALLNREGIKTVVFQVPGEPTIDLIRDGVHLARESELDLILGFGGGSVLDAGKAIASLVTNKQDLSEYLEVIGQSRPLASPSLPYFAIPTTAGTGAEVTRNAVLTSPKHKVKVSLRSPLMLPKVAVIDPTLTYSLPPQVTAGTGLDALTQLIEPLVSLKSNPMTDALCHEGIRRVANSLHKAYE